MIEYIKGELAELTPALAVVEVAGVGYALNISLTTYTALQGKRQVKLYVHEVLSAGGRDDSFTLYGFVAKQERALYHRFGGGCQHGAHDALVDEPGRTLQCHSQWR